MKKKEYKNYIFDLYGTLVDIKTNEQKPYLWEKLALIFGFYGAHYTSAELKKQYKTYCDELERQMKETEPYPELPLEKVIKRLFFEKGVQPDSTQISDLMAFMRVISVQHLKLYDGVTDYLQYLQKSGKGIYLLSNAQSLFTRPELIYLGLDSYFDGILISSEAGVKKPGIHFYQQLLNKYNLNVTDCIMIGNDSTSDIAGANSMGMDSLYIHSNQSPKLTKAPESTYSIMDGDFKQIKKLLND